MSLLMKALKQAEQRHQQATAEALERSAAEPLTGADPRADAVAQPDADIGTTDDSHERDAAANPPGARPRGGTRRGGTPLALEATPDALDDATAAASTNTARTLAELPVLTELTLAGDPPPTAAVSTDAGPAQTTVSRQVARRAVDPTPAAHHSMATAPAVARSTPEAGSTAADRAATRPIDRPSGGSSAQGGASGDPQIAPAQHLQPRVRPTSSRNRRIGLWAGVGTAVVVTGAWFGWQLLAPPPRPVVSIAAPPLEQPSPAATPTQADAAPTVAQDHPAAPRPDESVRDAAAAATTAAVATRSAADTATVPRTPRKAATAATGAPPAAEGGPRANDARPHRLAARPDVTDGERRRQADASDRTAEPVRAAEAPTRVVEPAAVATAPSAPRAEAAPPARTAAVRLVRSDEGERMARMLESAYTALQTRDIEAARVIYEQVLALDPNNTDALAGLATWSARAGNPLQAERLFNKVLTIDPNDQAARAGLVALRTSGDPAGQESQLRQLIAQDDGQPALHYALGNVLAAQGRWAEAQQSYFTAASGDAEQPDYAYNLAVSLERLKQPRAAAAHYRRALELAASRPARFPIERARTRLAALDGAARQGD